MESRIGQGVHPFWSPELNRFLHRLWWHYVNIGSQVSLQLLFEEMYNTNSFSSPWERSFRIICKFTYTAIGTLKADATVKWIHTLFAFLFILELSLILSPSIHAPPILARLFIPSLLLQKPQFIQISLLHRLFASLSVSLPQLLSVWNTDEDEASKARKEDEGWRVVVGLLKNLNEEGTNSPLSLSTSC